MPCVVHKNVDIGHGVVLHSVNYLSIELNPQSSSYETAKQHIEMLEEMGCLDADDWAGPDEREKSIETEMLWVARWYPRTPVAFDAVYAASLESLMRGLKKLNGPGIVDGECIEISGALEHRRVD